MLILTLQTSGSCFSDNVPDAAVSSRAEAEGSVPPMKAADSERAGGVADRKPGPAGDPE